MEDNKITDNVEEVDVEAHLANKIVSAETAEDAEKYAKAYAAVRKVDDDDIHEFKKLELEAEKNEKEAKSNKVKTVLSFAGTILAAVIGALGVVAGQAVKGEYDSRYQDEGYEHEKTESVIWNRNRHRR